MGARLWWLIVAVAVLGGVVVAIAVDDPADEAMVSGDTVVDTTLPGGIPVVDEAILGPGTEIAPGYEVVEGSFLVGGAIPSGSSVAHPGTWKALMIVTGDPDQVLADYTAQAEADGFAFEAGGRWKEKDRCGGRPGDPGTEWCSVTRTRESDSLSSAAFRILYTRGQVVDTTTSTLLLERMAYDTVGGEPPPEERPVRLDLPTSWSPLPQAGDPLWPPQFGWPEPVKVVRGTRPAAPGWFLDAEGCLEHAWLMWVDRDADPEEAFEAYLSQLGGDPEEDAPWQRTLDDGTKVRYEPRISAGSHDRYATLVQRPDGASYILLDGCN